jgi:undecaprenyl-phosphate 4-deoxy-4-formamido-L-arabinose transferase
MGEVKVSLSIVIPCYKDEERVPQIYERLGPVMDGLPGRSELVLVDDGSPDRTAERARQGTQGFEHPVTVVRLARNFGQHPAVMAGFEQCRGEVVVTMDSDMQYPPEQIPLLVGALSEDCPVVSGVRERRHDPLLRKAISRILSWWLGRQTGTKLRDLGSMFRAYDRAVVERLLAFSELRRFIPAMVAWLGIGVKEIPVEHEPRGEAGSRYRLGSLIDLFLDLLTGYSTFPLRGIAILGLIGSILGLGGTLSFLVYRVVAGAGVSGLVSALALVFFLLTIVLFVTAMIGEIAGRTYAEVRRRPPFVVADVTRRDA